MTQKLITVSYSELSTYQQCPLKHKLGYVDRWTSADRSPALARGSAWHAAMEAHYGMLRGWRRDHGDNLQQQAEQILQKCAEAVGTVLGNSGMSDEEIELLEWIYAGYVQQYGVDQNWQILAIEYNAVMPLYTPEGNRSRFRLKAKVDLVIRDLGLAGAPIKIVDHKTGKDLPGNKELDLADQFGLYEWLLRKQGKPVLGTVHSAARTQRNKSFMPLDTRFSRTRMNRTDHELKAIADDAYLTARQAYSATNLARPFSSPNPETCKWKCEFRDAHIYARKGFMPIESLLRGSGFVVDHTRH